MMKNIFLILLTILFFDIQSQKTFIPDNNFEQALIDLGYDSGPLNDSIFTDSINNITFLNIPNKGINDLTGIQDFTLLEYLSCNQNNLSNIDISQNIYLENFFCVSNQLTHLDISQNLLLEALYCSSNSLDSINVEHLTGLKYLTLENNNISSIEVNNNLDLEFLHCGYNPLDTLYVFFNTSLTSLTYNNTGISDLDISQNINLRTLSCTNNNIDSINISNNSLLENIYFHHNNFSDLDFAHLTNLKRVGLQHNNFTKLDFSNNINIFEIAITDNLLLNELNVKNANNGIINFFMAQNNPNLYCINVDDSTYSTNNWNNIDAQTSFGEFCYCIHQSFTINEELCFGSSYIVPSGLDTLLTTQQYIDTIPTHDGCDSVITINLVIRSLDGWSINKTICSDSYYITPSQMDTLYSSGFYFDTLQNSFGCDSVIAINLTVNPVTTENINVSICNGENYTSPSGMHTYNTSGQYFDTLQNQFTCDSIIAINLTVNPVTIESINVSICNGESYTNPSGMNSYSSSGQYYDTLQSQNSCDSIIEINLLVQNVDLSIAIDGNKLTIAESAVAYQWINCETNEIISGATEQNYFAEYNGSFACRVSKNTCTYESSCVDVNNVSINDISNSYLSVYPNPVSNILNISSRNSILNIRLYNLEGKELFQTNENFIEMINYSAGWYTVIVESNTESNKFKILKSK